MPLLQLQPKNKQISLFLAYTDAAQGRSAASRSLRRDSAGKMPSAHYLSTNRKGGY